MKNKKIAIIGKGTAGSLAIASISHRTPAELVWYTDPNSLPLSVGEGSTLFLPEELTTTLDMDYQSLKKIDGTFKHGIRKINWGGSGDYIHPFPLKNSGLHFNASKLQKHIQESLQHKYHSVETNIKSHDEIDADYIIDCSGKPSNYKDYNFIDSIPVNSSYITQCYWDFPKFDYTLTIARPYGWVFGIPLQNRCSIGYMYNSNINTLEEVKEDVKNIFEQFNLTPSENAKNINFENYYRKENFSSRVAYNGNASSFLEPLEATTIGTTILNNFSIIEILYNNKDISVANSEYLEELQGVQNMIMLHYLAGSKFNTKFWEFASSKAEQCLKNNIDFKFFKMYQESKFHLSQNRISSLNYRTQHFPEEIGQWTLDSYNINLKELNLYNKIDNILNNKKWL